MASTEMKQQLKKTTRNYGYLKVNLSVIDPNIIIEKLNTDVEWYNLATSTYEQLIAPFGDENNIFDDIVRQTKNYATLEPNFWVLDGSQPLYDDENDESEKYPQGYTSDYMSDEYGNYNLNRQTFEVMYVGAGLPEIGMIKATGLSFVFDSINNNYPSQIKVKLYNLNDEDNLVFEKIYSVDSPEFVIEFSNEENIEEFCKMEIEFIKSHIPNRRVRIEQIIFGYSKVFTNNEIISADSEERTTIINSELPVKNFQFTLDNINRKFDFDNPQGIYNYLLQNQPINYYWGYKLDGDYIEWILGGQLRLTGEINVNKNEVTIYAGSTLSLMNDEYKKGVYNVEGVSLYSLAEQVLQSKGITKYNLWNDLSYIKTEAGLPDAPHNELLQMIATAGLCTLYVDRNDCINIQPFNYDDIDTDKLDYDFAIETPTLQAQPLLSQVDVVVTEYSYNEDEIELYNASNVDIYDHYMNNPLTIEFDHDFASGIEVNLSNSNVECSFIETTNNGTHTKIMIEKWNNSATKYTDVVVTGHAIETSQYIISKNYDVENGEIITYENPLVTPMLIKTLGDKMLELEGEDPKEFDTTKDNSLAEFIGDWYTNRFIYSFNNRGDVLKDTHKIVTIETDFNSDLNGYLLENNISYNGAWRGFSKVIKMNALNESSKKSENGSE